MLVLAVKQRVVVVVLVQQQLQGALLLHQLLRREGLEQGPGQAQALQGGRGLRGSFQ